MTTRFAAPWVRTRLRATPVAALLTAALVLVTAFLAAALPRAADRGADGALRDLIARSGATAATVSATALAGGGPGGGPSGPPDQALDRMAQALTAEIHAPLRLGAGGPVWGSRAREPRALANPQLPRPGGLPPRLGLFHLNDLAGHARLTAGRWPAAADGLHYEVALSDATAARLGVTVGAVLDAGLGTAEFGGRHYEAEVVGVFAAQDPDTAFWAGTDCVTAPCLDAVEISPGERLPYWRAGAMIGRGELGSLPHWGQQAEDFVQLPIDVTTLRADRAPELQRALGSLLSGPQAARLSGTTGRQDLRVTSPLVGLLTRAEQRQAAVAPLTALGPVGAAGVALAVLCLAAALAAERRAAELRLLRARGGSRSGMLRRLLGESAVTTLPAALTGTALALLLLPTPRWGAAVLAGAAVAAVALPAFPLRAVLLPDAPLGSARRRLVAELAVLAAAAGAALAVRQRGIAPAGQGTDLLLVAAPLLIALAGAVLLARLQPALVGWAARRAGRRSGAIGFLGLTRAARGGGTRRPTLLPLLALLLAVTTAGFGATVLAEVDSGRIRAARIEVGADAKVTAVGVSALPDGFTDAAARLPGIHGSLPAWTDRAASLATADRGLLSNVTVLAVDPAGYAELARHSGQGTFDPAALAGAADDAVPALVTAGLADRLDDEAHAVHLGAKELPIRKAGVLVDAPGLGTGEAIVVPAGPAASRLPALARPNLWFGTGTVRSDALSDLLHRLDADRTADGTGPYQVRTSSETAARLAGDPLQHSAARLFWASIVAAGGFAVLAVLLTLARSGPDRAALLARLRTMGLRPRQGLALILAEALPQALAAAVAGALLAVLAVLLLGPAVDLSALVGAAVHAGVEPAARPVLGQALALAAVFAATVLAEAFVSGRRQITTELRAGDDR